MFQNTTDNDNDNEKSFSDAYRSEILDNNSNKKEEPSLKKLMFILLLVVLISTVSILVYKYFSGNTPPHNRSEATIETKMIEEEQKELAQEALTEDNLPQSTAMESMIIEDVESLEIMEAARVKEMIPTPTANKNDIDNIAEQMKLEIAKELDKKNSSSNSHSLEENSKESLPVSPQLQKGEDLYLRQLAELSKEIDEGKK